jgi:hypothetical protein
MWYWRDKHFADLRLTAIAAAEVPEWSDYAAYCSKLECGLRPQAFASLRRFIDEMKRANFSQRKRFVAWVLSHAEQHNTSGMLLPHPLHKQLVEPTLDEWRQREPLSSVPLRWIGTPDKLRLAITIDPSDEIAHRKLIRYILGVVSYDTHELPAGYLGDPQVGLQLLTEAEAALDHLSQDDERAFFAREITEERKLIQDYLREA